MLKKLIQVRRDLLCTCPNECISAQTTVGLKIWSSLHVKSIGPDEGPLLEHQPGML
jgi:hypothetical protein